MPNILIKVGLLNLLARFFVTRDRKLLIQYSVANHPIFFIILHSLRHGGGTGNSYRDSIRDVSNKFISMISNSSDGLTNLEFRIYNFYQIVVTFSFSTIKTEKKNRRQT